jgi:hypothetical protein
MDQINDSMKRKQSSSYIENGKNDTKEINESQSASWEILKNEI